MRTVISKLREPVCILGGWAVYFEVGENFKREHGRDYLGSRDIDLGFHVNRDWTLAELKDSDVAIALDALNSMGFQPLSFRFVKHFQVETMEELKPENAKKTPSYDIFDLYVDPIVDYIHPKFSDMFGFTPIDEPLLENVFTSQKHRIVELFGRRFLIPLPEVLLATKIRSVMNRDREQKRIKDVADIYALSWYSNVALTSLKSSVKSTITPGEIRKAIDNLTKQDLDAASNALGIETVEVKRVLSELVSN
jgi:hypothetical protein